MKRIACLVVAFVAACALALCVGCSAASSSSASSPAASGAAASQAASGAAALKDGEYTIEVTLSGGSGKASVESPAKLVVENGEMTATIVWSSKNYDKMIANGAECKMVSTGGNSAFEMPVSALDVDVPIQAETTAMSEPHMIDYTLHFDSGSIQ